MNKSDLKSLIRECFVEIIKESQPVMETSFNELGEDPKKFLLFLKDLQQAPLDVINFFDERKKEPQIYNGYDLTKLWKSLVMKNGEPKAIDGDIDHENTYKKYFSNTINENEGQPAQENELKRTQTDFEGGKIPRGLTKQPVKVQVKTELKSKDGVPVLKPSQTVDVFFGKRPTHIYVFSEGKWWSLSIQNASKYLTKFKPTPSINALEKMSSDGIVSTPLGTRVEPDGTGPNGEPSWLLVMGLI